MARGLKRSLLKDVGKPNGLSEDSSPEQEETAAHPETPTAFKRASAGAGSAWKAGALAETQAGLDEAREAMVTGILNGDQVLEIDPEMISDPVGTDRRSDWMQQEGFQELVESIKASGQDLPILVWPEDPNWRPDELDPKNLERIQFVLLAGRRRCEAARILGRPVRAVIASQEGRSGPEATFQMLVLRFRENEKRDDLSAFERQLSIGQMYEELSASSETKLTAKAFADRIGVHESVVSRSRAVYKAKDEILNAFKNVYDLSFNDFQKVLAQLADSSPSQTKKRAFPQKLKIVRKVGSRNLSVEAQGGKLSIKASGLKIDKSRLEGLGDLVAEYLNNDGAK
ncbi:MAG: ParB N-terminal domain-containing protein [Pseudomonadota bacterium]